MKKLRFLLLAIILGFGISTAGFAQTIYIIRWLYIPIIQGHGSGSPPPSPPENIPAVAVQGNYAYMTVEEGGLRIFAVTNPAAPSQVGSYDFSGSARGIALAGNHVYVAVGAGGLRAFDVSDPSAPLPAGSLTTGGFANGVALSGNYAYIADGNNGLQVIDVSNPSTPTRVGGVGADDARGVAVSGNYAYVATYGATGHGGLDVFDVSNPAAPSRVGSSAFGWPAYGVAVATSGNYVYVANGFGGLRVLNVSNPTAPSLVGTLTPKNGDIPADVHAVATAGDLAYIAVTCDFDFASGTPGLQVIDVRRPESPARIAGFALPTVERPGIAVSGSYAYAARGTNGLQIMDVGGAVPSGRVGGVVDFRSPVVDVAINNGTVYATEYTGLRIIDAANPASPGVVGGYDEFLNHVEFAGNLAFLGPSGGSGPRIVEINPTPRLLYDFKLTSGRVASSGGYLYMTDFTNGFRVFDIKTPSAPTLKGSLSLAEQLMDVAALSGHYAFTTYRTTNYTVYGVHIIDVENPASPTYVGGWIGDVAKLVVSGNHVFVAEYNNGLQIIDISNPSAPVRISHVRVNNACGVALDGGYAYVADIANGLQIIDVSNPKFPVWCGNLRTSGQAWKVAVTNGYAYVADGGWGLTILDVSHRSVVSEPVGGSATFSMSATNLIGPAFYQWQKDGSVLTNDARISGVNSTNLTISALRFTDSGGYTLTVSNSYGSLGITPVTGLKVVGPILSVIEPVTDTFRFQFTAASGFNYTVEHKPSVTNPLWTTIGTWPGSNSPVQVTQPFTPGGSDFFRVRVE